MQRNHNAAEIVQANVELTLAARGMRRTIPFGDASPICRTSPHQGKIGAQFLPPP